MFDIAKRFHEAAIIDQTGKIVVKRIRFDNSRSGFLKLMEAVRKLDASAEFGMEATGHYWLPLYATCICVKQKMTPSTL